MRERSRDIPALVEHFLRRRDRTNRLSAAGMMMEHSFRLPGKLANLIEKQRAAGGMLEAPR